MLLAAAEYTRSKVALRRLQISLASAAPIVFAVIALVLGKKTGWDLYNYHWYTPFALLNNRFGFDVAVSHHATYYNPVADLPLYWIVSQGPAWLGGVFMGTLAGVTVALIGAIAYRTLPIADDRMRTFAAALLAVLGAIGAGAWQEIGDPANDIPAGIGIFGALLILLAHFERLQEASIRTNSIRALVGAGLLVGAAVGLKLTTAVYAVGVVVALATRPGSLRTRSSRLLLFGSGAACGLVVVAGFWMLQMWQFSGNPFFPYFNGIFQSPLLEAASYRDPSFRPDSWLTALLFPYHFTVESRTVSESVFRDGHILAVYLLIPITAVIAWLRREPVGERALTAPASFLFVFALGSYAAWLLVFDIYRYLIPLEMIAPLLIVLAVSMWPIRPAVRVAVIAVTLIALQGIVRVDLSDRQSWRGPYVQVTAPTLAAPQKTMILMTGHAPMAYVIPFFPREVPFVRIDSWLVQGSDSVTGLARAMRSRVAAHDGDLFVLLSPIEPEREMALDAAAHYGLQLTLDSNRCKKVTSNIDAELWLCPAAKIAS